MPKIKLMAKETLEQARKEKGLTQHEVCELLFALFGVKATQGLYTKWESQIRPVSSERALQLSKIMERDIKDLFHVKTESNVA